jgi:hypothetical protein
MVTLPYPIVLYGNDDDDDDVWKLREQIKVKSNRVLKGMFGNKGRK